VVKRSWVWLPAHNNSEQFVHTHTYVHGTKQYNLLAVKGQWCCSVAGKLTSNNNWFGITLASGEQHWTQVYKHLTGTKENYQFSKSVLNSMDSCHSSVQLLHTTHTHTHTHTLTDELMELCITISPPHLPVGGGDNNSYGLYVQLYTVLCVVKLVGWLSGRTSVSDRWTFTGLHRTCSWWLTIYMGKPSAVGQPTRPTQPFILTGSINE